MLVWPQRPHKHVEDKGSLASGVADDIAATLSATEYKVDGAFCHNHGARSLGLDQRRNRAAGPFRCQVAIDIDRGAAMGSYRDCFLIGTGCRIEGHQRRLVVARWVLQRDELRKR